jgi:hypothetical protein
VVIQHGLWSRRLERRQGQQGKGPAAGDWRTASRRTGRTWWTRRKRRTGEQWRQIQLLNGKAIVYIDKRVA